MSLAEKYYDLSAKQGYEDAVNYLIRIKKKNSIITNFAVFGSNSDEFVKNSKGEYLHADIIDFSQEELEWILLMITSLILPQMEEQ